jgi:hypothetical protein
MPLSIKDQLEEYFKAQEKADEDVLNQIILYIYYLESKSSNSDLFILARLLPNDVLYKLISYYDGDILKMPSKEEFKKSYVVSICFYLKEVKGWSWEQIKEFFPSNPEYDDLLSSISIGKRINKVKDTLGKDLMNLIKTLKIEKIKKFQKELFNGKF